MNLDTAITYVTVIILLGFFLAGKSPKRASLAASSISAWRAASS